MKSIVTIRYISGREERFEVQTLPKAEQEPEARLRMFLETEALTLQTDEELIIIPRTAVEQVSVALPRASLAKPELAGVRQAKRVK